MCSEIETLDITEAEERAGLRRVYDLVDELPIPPDKTRKLAGYIARIEAERDEARAAAQAMSRPVSDEVWIKHSVMSNGLRVAGKDSVNALIAARVRDSKEADNGKNGR